MVLRYLCGGAALAAAFLATGCCCWHPCKSRACAPPAVVNTAPVACPCPDQCAPAVAPPAPVQAYSPPAPCCNGFPR